jgi:hypothetical protein
MIFPDRNLTEIVWWCKNMKTLSGKCIRWRPIDMWIEIDASLLGWGAWFEINMTGGRWTHTESCYHIHILELMAEFFFLLWNLFFKNYIFKHTCICVKTNTCNTIGFLYQRHGLYAFWTTSWFTCKHRHLNFYQ